MTIDLSGTLLPPETQRDVQTFCASVEGVCDDRLVGVSLYGSGARDDFRPRQSDVNLLVVVTALPADLLVRLREPVGVARRVGLSPLFLTESELRTSTDVFPVKYLAMKESHRVLLGRDVLGALPMGREHVRLRCEQELMNVVLRLRRHFLDGSHGLDRAIAGTAGQVAEVLRIALTLTGDGLVTRREVAEVAARRMGFEAAALAEALALRASEEWLPRPEIDRLFQRYLEAVRAAARFVDGLEDRAPTRE